MLDDEKLQVRYQLTSMGRARDIERLETKVEDDFGFRDTHTAESAKFESLQR